VLALKKPLFRAQKREQRRAIALSGFASMDGVPAHLRGVRPGPMLPPMSVLYEVLSDMHEDVCSPQGDRIRVTLDVSRGQYDELLASKPYGFEFRQGQAAARGVPQASATSSRQSEDVGRGALLQETAQAHHLVDLRLSGVDPQAWLPTCWVGSTAIPRAISTRCCRGTGARPSLVSRSPTPPNGPSLPQPAPPRP
jgi:hypothetical protein